MAESGSAWAQTTVKDELTASDFAATGNTYTDFSDVSKTSDAVYAGNSAKDGSGNIQLRSKNSNSGIVSTTSGGTVKSVKITVGSGSNTIDVYGSNKAYTAASDLYGDNKGTKIGSLTETGTITFPAETDYKYVGIRSNNGAIYLSSIEITWNTSGGGGGPTTYTVTYDGNGNTSGTAPTDATAYSSGATVTVKDNTGSLAKAGYIFGGWNTQADGLGTNYTAGSGTFSITANTTLYAKWNAKTITGLSYSGTPTKTTYNAGENFDPTGLTVTATFDDSSEEDVTTSVTWTPSPLTAGTTSVTGTYLGQTVNITGLTVTAAPGTVDNPFTTMDAIFAAATSAGSTATDCIITFNNWVVTGVKNSNAYVTDGTKGFIIYANSHGFAVGNVLSGTVACKVQLYNGAAEITNLTSSTSGLTVTTGGTVTPQVVAISDLSGVNTGAVIQVKNVTYVSSSQTLIDASSNAIKPWTTLYSGSYSDGQMYNVTGVYLQYNTTKEILPRSSADIEEVNDPALTASLTTAVPNYVQGTPEANITLGTVTVGGTYLTDDVTVALAGGASSAFEIYDAANTTWTSSITLSPTTGTLASTEISVRLKEGQNPDDYEDQINVTSTGATAKNVAVAASVTTLTDTYDMTLSNGDIVAAGNAASGYAAQTITDSNSKAWNAYAIKNYHSNTTTGNHFLQIKKYASSTAYYIQVPEYGRKITKLEMTVSGSNAAMDGGGNSATLYFSASNSTSATGTGVASGTGASKVTIDCSSLNLNTGYITASGAVRIWDVKVTYDPIRLNSYGYATYAGSTAINYSDDSKFSAWAITSISGDAITFSKITGSVPAGTGVLLMGTAGEAVEPVVAASGTAPETNLFTGITTATEVTADQYYGLSGNQFVKVGAGTVPAGKALLPASKVSDGARLTFVFEDETTGIGDSLMKSKDCKEINDIFDLHGRRIVNPTKGLYIKNGKKVIVK